MTEKFKIGVAASRASGIATQLPDGRYHWESKGQFPKSLIFRDLGELKAASIYDDTPHIKVMGEVHVWMGIKNMPDAELSALHGVFFGAFSQLMSQSCDDGFIIVGDYELSQALYEFTKEFAHQVRIQEYIHEGKVVNSHYAYRLPKLVAQAIKPFIEGESKPQLKPEIKSAIAQLVEAWFQANINE